MATSKRFFTNKLADFSGSKVEIPKSFVKSLCLSYLDHILDKQGVTAKDCDGALYTGVAGVAYMCYHLSKHPDFSDKGPELLEKSKHYVRFALEDADAPKNRSDRCAFLLGGCGSYATAAALMNALEEKAEANKFLDHYTSLADSCTERDYLGCGSDELLVGRAGYLSGILFLEKEFQKQVLPDEKINALCNATVQSGLWYSNRHHSPCPLMYSYYDTEYLGAAHGLSGILQMLLSFPQFLSQHPDAESTIKSAVDYFLTLQLRSGNFPSAMDEVKSPRSEDNELVHWCHGAPGVVYLMAKAYLLWKDDKYLQSCLSCGEMTWNKGLLRKGAGICHGIAGSGYVFLLLYRLTGVEKHLHRAIQFAQFLLSDDFKAARTPDRPLSLYEGLSGTVCFLADLLQPDKAHFPFFDVF